MQTLQPAGRHANPHSPALAMEAQVSVSAWDWGTGNGLEGGALSAIPRGLMLGHPEKRKWGRAGKSLKGYRRHS